MNYQLVLTMVLGFVSCSAMAQHVEFPDDNIQRGYYDRPYLRYEAEPEHCTGIATFLESTHTQTEVQSEASNQMAAQLIAKGDYVEWTNDEAADGLTIRFSLPDAEDGNGIKGIVSLYVDDEFVTDIELDSYWAWQYTVKTGNIKYPDNTPSTDKFVRMRFDEKYCLLDKKIPQGAKFRLQKADDNELAYIIDFVELEPVPEPVTYESIEDENKVMFEGTTGDALQSFINNNPGKTIYVPAGRYVTRRRMLIDSDNTKLIGAGMWYTELYFSASSDDRGTYSARGIQSNSSNITIQGMTLSTINNKRYFENNSAKQVGKGLMGSFGSNSVIKDVRIDHFECGGWISNDAGTACKNLLVQHCRFRNNYADGINLCSGTENAIVEHCSFRNNGDDDMASWSANTMCVNNTYRYNTAENNWRASSLGFFGGKQNKAHHCVIIDAMEAGFRALGDFPGTGFSSDGYTEFSDISVYRSGCKRGTVGVDGDFWGNANGAVYLIGNGNYNLTNISLKHIDIYDSKDNALWLGSNNGKKITGLVLEDINIDGTGNYGIYFSNTCGDGTYCDITYSDIGAPTDTNTCPTSFNFEEKESGVDTVSDVFPFCQDNVIYVNLQGVCCDKPCSGICIRVVGGKVEKVIIK